MTDNNKVIDIVENLLQICRDGQNGFRESAQHVKNPGIRELFNELSLERAQFAGELQNELIRLGKKDVQDSGTVSGKLHRAWIDLKANLGGGDSSILASAENGEDAAKKAYQEAEQASLPSDVRSIISRQAQSIFAAHDRVRALRDQLKAA
jgi:uncharacterized protein (TIGR02284 family)